jgi:enoyl-CoA hydratase
MLEYSRHGAIATLTVRRAEKKNAFNEAMWRSLLVHCQRMAAETVAEPASAPRVLLLQGQPGAFCAGADIEEMQTLMKDAAVMAANNVTVAQAQLALEHLPLPTLAVIDGPCFGGGFGIAAACDFRLGSTRSLFAITPAKLGLLYSLEDTRRVVALLGPTRAKRLLMRSERLDAPTALHWGVLDALVEPDALAATANEWATQLATQSRTSLAGIKATVAFIEGNPSQREPELRAAFDAAFAGADFAEGTAAFLAKRTPDFG